MSVESPLVMDIADRPDLPDVLRVQKVAFGRVADEFDLAHDQLPPLRETVDDLAALLESGTRFFIARNACGVIVGSVRASRVDSIVEIGRLVVDDGWTRRGVGTALMIELEAAYPDASCFRLFTGAQADAPLALYRKLGYRVTSHDDAHGVALVWMEKDGPGHT